MRKYLLFVTSLFVSCQEEITLDLPKADDKIVVQGAIENGYPPYVVLTKNQGYFDAIDNETYTDLFINDVTSVKVWYYKENGELSNEPKILNQVIGLDSLLPPIFTDLTGNIPYEFSKAGRTYLLEIEWNDKIISAETTIPFPTPLDCLWVERDETEEKDYKYDIRAIYSDPANEQNNILIKSKRLQHIEWKDSLKLETKDRPDNILKLIDAGPDVLVNGETFETYFPRPSDNGFPTGKYNGTHVKENENGVFNFKNDIVLIKFCQIDEPSLKFWRGLIRQAGTNGNPFAEPMNLVSNITNGLGVWTGYGSVYYKVDIIEGNVVDNEYTIEEGLDITDIF